MAKLSPSVLNADFTRLGEQIKILENEKVPYLHIDVMDGMFVPNISMGMPIIKSIRKFTDMVLDVHLMIERPERYIDDFVECGCDIINFHAEATNDIEGCIKKIKEKGKKVGITIKPQTSEEEIFKYLKDVDLVLVMSVEPGFGGQKFMTGSLKKVNRIAEYIKKNSLSAEIEIDGGISLNNIREVINAGTDVIVVGSAIFSKQNITEEIKKYQSLFKEYNR
ncbi:MAG: ribulose-phosphate 3-epimerase [Firmicutes bacterium]|nr:ribulose-phosphate 3-epimerase [Bacillota bacterium]